MRVLFPIFFIASAFLHQGCNDRVDVKVSTQPSNSVALLQSISIVDDEVAWVGGHQETLLRTLNGGNSWEVFQYEMVDSLQFRDIHAFSREEVIVMSSGLGSSSRIFKFHPLSGFEEVYRMPFSEGFLNSIGFWVNGKGIAFGDSFKGELFILKTLDRGSSWSQIPPETLPTAGSGEGGFAASGTCIATRPGGEVWIGTGAGGNARVLYSKDYGDHWESFSTPMVKGLSGGIFSIRHLGEEMLSIAGGDLSRQQMYMDNIAFSEDAGKSWTIRGTPVTKGTFYGSAGLKINGDLFFMVCGPNGMDYSLDGGSTFHNLDTTAFWAVELHRARFGYAVGPEGKVVRIDL